MTVESKRQVEVRTPGRQTKQHKKAGGGRGWRGAPEVGEDDHADR